MCMKESMVGEPVMKEWNPIFPELEAIRSCLMAGIKAGLHRPTQGLLEKVLLRW